MVCAVMLKMFRRIKRSEQRIENKRQQQKLSGKPMMSMTTGSLNMANLVTAKGEKPR